MKSEIDLNAFCVSGGWVVKLSKHFLTQFSITKILFSAQWSSTLILLLSCRWMNGFECVFSTNNCISRLVSLKFNIIRDKRKKFWWM